MDFGLSRRTPLGRILRTIVNETAIEFAQRETRKRGWAGSAFDRTVSDALQYEIYRLIETRSGPAKFRLNDLVEMQVAAMKSSRASVLLNFFSDEHNVDALSRFFAQLGLGHLSWNLDEIYGGIRKLNQTERFFSREPASNAEWQWVAIPNVMRPKTFDAFAKKSFAYRWCLLCAEFLGMRRQKAIECYEVVRDRILEGFKDKELDDYKSMVDQLPSFEIFPNRESDENKNAVKAADIFANVSHPAWILEFMHADYANLIDWDSFRGGSLPMIPKFIRDTLGIHLLRAKFEKGWHWRKNSAQWKKALDPGQAKITKLRFVKPNDTQPLLIGKKLYAFDYVLRTWDASTAQTQVKIVSSMDFTKY